MSEKRKLKKELGVFSATSVVVGCVIGAGVFFKPYAIYQATGGAPGMGMLAWIVGGLASIFAALTFAEVAVLIPKTGGMVAYLGEVFGERVGFLAGWMQVVIFYPAFLAGYGVKVGEELSKYIGAQFELPIAMAVIIIMVALNTLGNKTTGRIQVVSTVCKLVPLVLLMIFGFVLGSGDNPIFTPLVAEGKSAPAVLGSTLLAVLFAFEGWTNVGAIAGEMKNPGRDLPRAIVGGVSIIMLVYFVINMAYLWVLPADELMNLESPAAAVAMQIFWPNRRTAHRDRHHHFGYRRGQRLLDVRLARGLPARRAEVDAGQPRAQQAQCAQRTFQFGYPGRRAGLPVLHQRAV